MRKDIYQHFSVEDISFIDKGLEWLRQVEEHYASILTPFINPHQVFILKTLGNHQGIQVFSSNDFVATEYSRVLLAPDYFIPTLTDFEMELLEIVYSSKFDQLTHSKILGTVLNRLGIDRKLFGDILVTENRAQIIVDQKFTSLFQDGIQKIARLPVKLEVVSFEELVEAESDYQEKEVLVPSMRLDAFLSNVLKLSRSQTADLLERKYVQVNYHLVEKSDYQVQIGDLVSVRRFGRIILLKENGQTKKDKKKIKIGYFSGSITHNENFDLIRSAILKILKEFPQTELHLVGHLTIPDEMKNYKKQLIVHDFLDWTLLPSLVAEMDINLAPLVDNVFNRAKSEIKWLEAALVGVTTVASDIGSFSEIITNETTGVLVADGMWYEQLKDLIDNKTKLEFLGNNAKRKVISTYKTTKHKDEFIEAIHG